MHPNEEKLELISQVIQKLIEEDKKSGFDGDGDGDGDQILLSRLLSELQVVKEEEATSSGKEEEIIKEIKTLKRQNRITHLLLSLMIALTLVWQLSEVSLILKIKNGLTLNLINPFKSLHNIFSAIAKPHKNTDNEDKASSSNHQDAAVTFQIPDLPHIDIPGMPST